MTFRPLCTFNATLVDPNAIHPITKTRSEVLRCDVTWPCSGRQELVYCSGDSREYLFGGKLPRRDKLRPVLDLGFYLNKDVKTTSLHQFSLTAVRRLLPLRICGPSQGI